jgi:carbon monoxide dehydrogenase subunit G
VVVDEAHDLGRVLAARLDRRQHVPVLDQGSEPRLGGVQLSNEFEVSAGAERTWALLTDVPRVVPCMPGAKMTKVVAENEWEATLHVKLGPISLQFLTDVTREEVDEEARRVVLAAKAREAKNRGGADARLESTVAAVDGGTRVEILTDLTLRGAVAQYGRSVVPEVAAQLTKQFAACLQRQLAEDAPPEPAAASEPVRGLRLGVAALWRSLLGRFRR